MDMMDEIFKNYGEVMEEMSKDCTVKALSIIANEMFLDKMTVARIAFFIAFSLKLIEKNPDKKHEIHEKVITNICKFLKF